MAPNRKFLTGLNRKFLNWANTNIIIHGGLVILVDNHLIGNFLVGAWNNLKKWAQCAHFCYLKNPKEKERLGR